MRPAQHPERAYTAVALLEVAMRLLDTIYTESAKGEKADILNDLATAKRHLESAQQRQLRHYDAKKKGDGRG